MTLSGDIMKLNRFAFIIFVIVITGLISMVPLFFGVSVYSENYREHRELKEFRESGANVTEAQLQKWIEEERQLNKNVKAPLGIKPLLKACQSASIYYNWVVVFLLFLIFKQSIKTTIIFTIILLVFYISNWLIFPMLLSLIGASVIANLISKWAQSKLNLPKLS